MSSDYYVKRQGRLLRQFNWVAARVRKFVNARYGKDAGLLTSQARREFAALIPRLPYVGGDGNPLTEIAIAGGWLLAIYRVLRARGGSAEQAARTTHEMLDAFVRSMPLWPLRLYGRLAFRRNAASLRRRAAQSQLRHHPGAWVYRFVEGDGRTFDYGVDYVECATCAFLDREGAPELAPYMCLSDVPIMRALGWGLTRTKTIAGGADCCDFRFKLGGPTRVEDSAAAAALYPSSGTSPSLRHQPLQQPHERAG
jgi:hypothetical protein